MDLGTAAASAWSSGISMWAVAALLGIAGRLDWIDSPEFVQKPWVIVISLILAMIELVVDKIAYLDSTWDTVHTALRPLAGALLLGSSDVSVADGLLLVAGGLLALSSHAAKASTRLLVNLSPEPISNIFVSSVEDGLVALLLALAIAYPALALVVTLVLAVCSAVAALLMYRAVRAAWLRRPWSRRRTPSTGP
jgi:hypothetical protein